jgi:hypothetical protein
MSLFRYSLGTLALLAVLSGCGGSSNEAPAPLVATTATIAAGNNQSATVGAKPAQAIVVSLVDRNGGAVANATATVSVTTGGGTVSPSIYTSDSAGKVSITGWTLGNTAGDQTISVTSGSASATATVKATAGAAAKIAVLPDNITTGNVGATVSAPGVLVSDSFNNPVAGVQVDFSVAANNGSLGATSATTNAAGIARVPGWTLGALVGAQKVTAKVGSFTTDLSVAAKLAEGCVTQPAAIGLTTSGTWSTSDCQDTALARRYDEYSLKLTAQGQFKARVTGANGRQFRVFTSAGRAVGEQPSDAFAPATVNPLELQYVLPAGDYLLRVYAPDATTVGDYTLQLSPDFSNAITDAATCRPVIFATFGSTVTQSLTRATSCSFQGDIEDRYIVLLQTGEKVSINLATTAFSPYLILRDDRTPTSPAVATKRLAAPGTASVEYTATFNGFHEIIVTSNTFVSEGSYTLSITKP